MDYTLSEHPENVTVIEGFPGFGLVGTIVNEYLLENLDCRKIGEFLYDDLPPTAAIHDGKLVNPMGIYYNEKYNLIILHTILDVKSKEWDVSDAIKRLTEELSAKEIISIEGVASDGSDNMFCYNNDSFQELGAKPIKESVIMGVSAALLLCHVSVSCLFAQTNSEMPDSRASAEIIRYLDKYIGFNLETEPLLEQAKVFEEKVKGIKQQSKKTSDEAEKKQMSYLG